MILSSCYTGSRMSYYQQRPTTTASIYAQNPPVYYSGNQTSSTGYYSQSQVPPSPPQQYYYVEQPRNQGWSSTTSFLVGAATGYILGDLSHKGRRRGYQSYYHYSQPWSAPAYYTPWMKNFGRSFHHGSGRVYHDISRGYYNGYGSIANGYQNGYGQIVQGLWR